MKMWNMPILLILTSTQKRNLLYGFREHFHCFVIGLVMCSQYVLLKVSSKYENKGKRERKNKAMI